jgi:mannose-6-phosphate isomerase-like protein (cupin superfamily)
MRHSCYDTMFAMSFPIKNIAEIAEEIIHNDTTHRKRLISSVETHRGDIATMNYAWLEPNKQLETHSHPDGEEFYFFLSGTGEMLVGESWHTVRKGDFVTVPVAHAHSLKNTSSDNLVFITIRTVSSPQS